MLMEFVERKILGAGGIIASLGGVFGLLTSDSVVPMMSMAAGASMGVVYLYYAPRDAGHKRQVDSLTKQLEEEIEGHDKCRVELRAWKNAAIGAGVNPKDVESAINRSPPATPV